MTKSKFDVSHIGRFLESGLSASVYCRAEGIKVSTQYSWMFAFATEKIRLFQYRKTRSAAFLSERFRDFQGVLASDGYKSYDILCHRHKIQHAACWPHTRRKFFELTKISRDDGSFAHQIIEEIGKLYAIEARCREKEYPPEKRLECRAENSRNIVDRIFELLKNKMSTITREQTLGKAIRVRTGNQTAVVSGKRICADRHECR